MGMKQKALSIALCAGLTTSGIAVPHAEAAVSKYGQQMAVDSRGDNPKLPYITALIDRGAGGHFEFVHPGSSAKPYTFEARSTVTVDDAPVPTDWKTDPQSSSVNGADVLTFTQSVDGVDVTRTFTVAATTVETAVTLRNTGDTPAPATIDLGVKAEPHFAYAPKVDYLDGARTFDGTLAPGEEKTLRATVSVKARENTLDSDGDGLRDSWERSGMMLADGSVLPIHKWGADEDVPDLFLQLNWMKSEWETLGCDRPTSFPATAEGFTEFARCAQANTNSYGPDIETLKELEKKFDDNGINLHIDAGEGYVSQSMASMPKSMRQGGPKLDYQQYFFGLDGDKNAVIAERLIAERDRLLGPRKSAFRVGIIGDQRAPGNYSTGVALTGDSVFYVSNFGAMTRQDELRNTILHEFGHTLGLKHWGAQTPDNTAPHVDSLSEYKSVMSYNHQLTHFDYAQSETNSNSYYIPADWPNLNFPGINIGRNAADYVGGDSAEPAAKPEVFEEHLRMEELIELAAEENQGKAGFRMVPTKDGRNGIVTLSGKNAVRGEVLNLGSAKEDFTVEVEQNGTVARQEVTLNGAGTIGSKKTIDIPVNPASLINNPVVQLNVRVKDASGAVAFSDSFKVSALDYNSEQADKVLKEVLASDADESVKKLARQMLEQKEEVPNQKKGESNTSTVAIIIAAVLGVVGLGALAYGWAVNQGIVKLPF
ncbi:hypothetical protein A0K93_03190 [Corynebacterium sp. BCW_4722]|nr:hypothetical protein A0K93_03190 [Corynebacterium sp. BCW_4722]